MAYGAHIKCGDLRSDCGILCPLPHSENDPHMELLRNTLMSMLSGYSNKTHLAAQLGRGFRCLGKI